MESNIVRLTYSRNDSVKYVSHLDLVHVFERALRRANLPVAYSNGFNPRMCLIFGNPLPVGLTSDCEMIDIEFTESIVIESTVAALAANLPEPIKILNTEPLSKPYENIVKKYTKATYMVKLSDAPGFIEKAISFFETGLSLVTLKKSKSGEKEIDIRPMIFDVKKQDDFMVLTVSHIPEASVKAELCVRAFSERLGIPCEILSIHKISVS